MFNTVPTNQFANGYTPGQLYNLTVNVSSLISPATGNTKDGFQITALDASNDSAGTFSISNANLTVLDVFFDRQYVSHKNVTAGNTPAWTFRWQAPAAGTGTVTFYIAANRSNNNSDSSGDNIYTQSFTIAENAANPCGAFNAFVTTPGGATSFCTGQSLNLTAGSNGGGGNPTYAWNTGGTQQTIAVNSPNTYTVTVTDGACTATASVTVAGVSAGVADFSVSVTENTVVINNNSTGVTGNYGWDFGNGAAFPDNSASFSFTYDTLGTYTITLEYNDVCGNIQTATEQVTISTISSVSQPSLAGAVSIYPNPFGNQATININGFSGATFQFTLVDITGKTVRKETGMAGNSLLIDRDGLQSGMYFYNIQVQGQNVQGKLLID